MTGWPAFVFAALCLCVIGFQIALILGAPWGRLTQGGRHDGALALRGRLFAAISAVLMGAMALAVLSAAGNWPGWPRWTGWATLAVMALSTLANWVTPSAAERRLWAPVISTMLALALWTMLVG